VEKKQRGGGEPIGVSLKGASIGDLSVALRPEKNFHQEKKKKHRGIEKEGRLLNAWDGKRKKKKKKKKNREGERIGLLTS